jgi:hypothetical protein
LRAGTTSLPMSLAQPLLVLMLLVQACVHTITLADASAVWLGPSDTSRGALHAAIDAVAAAGTSTTTTIHLSEGHHRLGRPLRLDQRHSGVRVVGHGTVVISGGVEVPPRHDGSQNITGWTIAGNARCRGCGPHIWKASIPIGADSRQFYINGVRANRTWMPVPAGATKDPKASAISIPGVSMLGWSHNQTAIELVYRGAVSAGSQWQESRCPVASIENGSAVANAIAGGCAANYCAAPMCPECCGQNACRCEGTGGVVNATPGVYRPGSVVCPPDKPICVAYVYDKAWVSLHWF